MASQSATASLKHYFKENMATPNYKDPTFAPLNALNKVLDNTLVDLRTPSNVTLANLVNAGRAFTNPGEKYFNWDVTFGGADTNWTDYDAVSTISETSVTLPATIPDTQKRVYHRFKVDRTQVQNLARTAPGQLKNLMQRHLSDGIIEILRSLNRAIVNPVSGSDIISLGAVLDDTAPYAGIAPAGVSAKWIPVVNKSGTERAFSRDLMLAFDAQVQTSGQFYDMVMMHPNMVLKYIKAYDNIAPAQSLVNDTSPAPFKRIDLGYGQVTYNGMPIIQEPELPFGTIRYMRSDVVELYFRDLTGGVGFALDAYRPTVVNNTLGIPIHITEYYTGVPTVVEYEMWVMGQVVVRNRQGLMEMRNVTV
jgi:hypothetical protein